MLVMVGEVHRVLRLALLQADQCLARLGLVLSLGQAVIGVTAGRARPPVSEVGPLMSGLPSPTLFGTFHRRGAGE
jgi:hypothetical protein